MALEDIIDKWNEASQNLLSSSDIRQAGDDLANALLDMSADLGRSRVQLAGCSVAALGGTESPAKEGDWGWSIGYQDVLNLRLKYEGREPYTLIIGSKYVGHR